MPYESPASVLRRYRRMMRRLRPHMPVPEPGPPSADLSESPDALAAKEHGWNVMTSDSDGGIIGPIRSLPVVLIRPSSVKLYFDRKRVAPDAEWAPSPNAKVAWDRMETAAWAAGWKMVG